MYSHIFKGAPLGNKNAAGPHGSRNQKGHDHLQASATHAEHAEIWDGQGVKSVGDAHRAAAKAQDAAAASTHLGSYATKAKQAAKASAAAHDAAARAEEPGNGKSRPGETFDTAMSRRR